ncbi:hypothetical protein FISHEDRAFT_73582 [Fistulina hepatica ATCC 64428]|uniref:Uncharacterized protein n=1 Tax=Fistulina hepatica ATCC 64428 TaxID=1128425 RepID=A0A0D7AFD4_9AGAR|nr:hypothetical protein FISHEDRAFT_73582 [Fistulina hepatica ATCC 64428]
MASQLSRHDTSNPVPPSHARIASAGAASGNSQLPLLLPPSINSPHLTSAPSTGSKVTAVRRSLRWIRRSRTAVIIALAAWSVYTIVRYFIAQAHYPPGSNARVLSIVFGTFSGAALACMTLAVIAPLLLTQTAIVLWYTLHTFAALFILVPASGSVVCAFIWRHSGNTANSLQYRCHLDVDVVWAYSSDLSCHGAPWGFWLSLSLGRLIITLLFIVIYIATTIAYDRMNKPTVFGHQRQSSRLSSSHSEFQPYDRPQRPPMVLSPSVADALDAVTASFDGDMQEFAHQFRTLVAQISRETEEGLAYAQSDIPSGAESYESGLDERRSDESTSVPLPLWAQHRMMTPATEYVISVDEFGRPYPPEDHIQLMNGIVRRMPTIESFGSWELSRPPTSLTLARTATRESDYGHVTASGRGSSAGARTPGGGSNSGSGSNHFLAVHSGSAMYTMPNTSVPHSL